MDNLVTVSIIPVKIRNYSVLLAGNIIYRILKHRPLEMVEKSEMQS